MEPSAEPPAETPASLPAAFAAAAPAAPPAAPPPTPLFSLEPPPRRRFAWGAFFVGVGTGVFGTVLMMAIGIALILMAAKSMLSENSGAEAALMPPSFRENGPRSFYGEAEPTWTLHTLTGESVKLADYRGKVVFVNFWATWCGPCILEMPSIQRLQDKMKDSPVVFLLISDEDAGTIGTFLKKKPWTMQSLRGDGNPPSVFRSNGIPATFVVDPSGMVVYRHLGAARWDADVVVTFLRGLS